MVAEAETSRSCSCSNSTSTFMSDINSRAVYALKLKHTCEDSKPPERSRCARRAGFGE